MSDDDKEVKPEEERVGAGPFAARLPRTRLYIEDLRVLKEIFSEPLKWAIYAAGVGGVVEFFRAVVDVVWFFATTRTK